MCHQSPCHLILDSSLCAAFCLECARQIFWQFEEGRGSGKRQSSHKVKRERSWSAAAYKGIKLCHILPISYPMKSWCWNVLHNSWCSTFLVCRWWSLVSLLSSLTSDLCLLLSLFPSLIALFVFLLSVSWCSTGCCPADEYFFWFMCLPVSSPLCFCESALSYFVFSLSFPSLSYKSSVCIII